MIVERGDDETLGVLVRNDTRPPCPAGPARRWWSGRAPTRRWRPRWSGRRSLPLGPAERDVLRGGGAAARAHPGPQRLGRPPGGGGGPGARRAPAWPPRSDAAAGDLAEAEAEIEKLASRRRLTAPTLLGFLRSSQRTHFAVGLARLAEVDAATVRTVMDRGDLDALAVVCKAAELDRSMFLTFAVLTCGGRDAMGRAADLRQAVRRAAPGHRAAHAALLAHPLRERRGACGVASASFPLRKPGDDAGGGRDRCAGRGMRVSGAVRAFLIRRHGGG